MQKYLLFSVIISATLFSCGTKQQPVKEETIETFPEKIAGATIYEVNIRQHTPEGTILAFMNDLPRLNELGVQVLWIMPIQPIGMKNRKGSLGSYYAINDHRKINPEFGSAEDFKKLVAKAHELNMLIILDWVPNHTAWDHPWITSHPDYYAKDNNGNITYEADWTDIALLNHLNPDTRSSMIEEMKYWVTEFDIDGFRCDHAGHEIPLYFWEEAIAAVESIKDVFWLAEWDGARMHLEFDATYAWELLHLTNKVAKGESDANDIANWIQKDQKEYGRKPFRMTMITNHDENSWKGTEFERYGDGVKTFATFIFTAYGIPMLYSGQEVGLSKRLRFFEKDTVDWEDPMKLEPFYKKLVSLHFENKALWSGEYGGVPVRINEADKNVYAFKRIRGSNQVIVILNFSPQPQEFKSTDSTVAGTYEDYFTGNTFEISTGKSITLSPWQYLVFVKR